LIDRPQRQTDLQAELMGLELQGRVMRLTGGLFQRKTIA
jgi:hypothetical protein